MLLRNLLVLILFVTLPGIAIAQEPDEASSAPLQVYIDCEFYVCDFDYFRTEILFVDYVRDRQDADVHILVTTQQTGGGGREYSIAFIGQQRFEGVDETLRHVSEATATDDEIRRGLTRIFRVGLLRYISRTPQLDRFEISYDAPDDAAQAQAEEDPWNYWVFNTRLSGFANGEDRYQFLNVNGSASASRVTEDLKLSLSLNGSRRSQTFELSDGSTTENIQESFGASGLGVYSLGPHWSAGVKSSVNRSTRFNYELDFVLAPAIEYNVYPYSESTRKLLTVQYAVGLNYLNYSEITIFDKTEEALLRHALESVISLKQPWGNIGLSLQGSQFFFDLSKFSLNLGGSGEMRLFRGFSVQMGGNVAFVRDQLYLPKGDASDEDVLLRRRELETNWRYFFSVGLGYRFGSKFNNVVNPRFGGGGRSFFFF